MTPALLIGDATSLFLISMLALVGYRLLTGAIRLDGLFHERDAAGRLVYSPARLQLLLVTLVGIAQYFVQLSQRPANLSELPGIDTSTLSGLGGSQALFLASKAWAAYQARKSH
ncbi:MAG TPA: hypothetical protein VN648_13200 [Candidatus Methylomirabilis sp.]|nr:hypothetical protein [Candidatus Methylomirabilis sp.]